MSRYLSIRVEVEVDADGETLPTLGRVLAQRAREAIETHPRVLFIAHAAHVTRRP